MSLEDLPGFTREVLGLHGLNLSTDLLKGAGRGQLEALRSAADRAACACLLLTENTPLSLSSKASVSGPALERLEKVIRAAYLLGCPAAAISIKAPDSDEAFGVIVDRLKKVIEIAEGMDMNLLIAPREGLTARPERVTDLIKKIGGFRVGTFPDFETASTQDDPVAYIRRLTPYASVVSASTKGFVGIDPKEKTDPEAFVDETVLEHEQYDLQPLVGGVRSVGFDGTLAIDYRGTGDGTQGVIRSKRAIEAAIEREAEQEK